MIAVGDSKSYGLDLYGMLSLTPFAKDEKDKGLLTIAFPFRFQNVIGVQRKEYSNLIYETNNYKFISGQKRALQDYAYGAEVDLVLKTDVARFTIGAGTVVKVDRRADVITITDSLATLDLTDNADLATFYSDHYVRASDSRGQASYVFAHVRFGKFGLVGRISSGTGTGSLNEKLGVVDGVSTTERTIIEDIIAGNGIDGNLTPSVFRNMDQGRSRFQKTLLGVTYNPNARFSVAMGISVIKGLAGNGEEYRVNDLSAIKDYNADSFAATVAPGSVITDNDLIGEKNYDQKTFVRAVYRY